MKSRSRKQHRLSPPSIQKAPAWLAAILLAAVAFHTASPGAAAQEAGELDPLFGDGGKVQVGFLGPADTHGFRAALSPDGTRFVVSGAITVGEDHNEFLLTLTRFLANGALDTSFGPDHTGYVVTDILMWWDFCAVTYQPDGKIVAVGAAITETGADFLVARFNEDGSPDTSFGSNGTGIVTTSFPGEFVIALSTAVQTDGKIVVAGGAELGLTSYHIALARYLPDGSLDQGFGEDGTGWIMTEFPATNSLASSIAIQDDDRIVVAGAIEQITAGSKPTPFRKKMKGLYNEHIASDTGADMAVVRYLADGTLDTPFGDAGTGLVAIDIAGYNDLARAVAIDKNDRIVAGGYAHQSLGSEFAIIRLLPDGRLDMAFDQDGIVSGDFLGGKYEDVWALQLQPDGKIVAVSTNDYDSSIGGSSFALARLNPDGSLDQGFGTNGLVTQSLSEDLYDKAYDAVILDDGRIIGVGTVGAAYDEIGLICLLSDGRLDAGFGPFQSGVVFAGIRWHKSEWVEDVFLNPSDGTLLLVGTSWPSIAIARLDADGILDPTFGDGGQVVTRPAKRFYDVLGAAMFDDGSLILAGEENYDFFLQKYLPSGMLDASFGEGGILPIDRDLLRYEISLTIQDQYHFIATGTSSRDGQDSPVMIRFLNDGSIDQSFGVDGIGMVTNPLPGEYLRSTAILVDKQGKIVVAGIDRPQNTTGQIVLARYTSDGVLDTTFGDAGSITTDLSSLLELYGIETVALQSNGDIVLFIDGRLIVRYHHDGTFDTDFLMRFLQYPPIYFNDLDFRMLAIDAEDRMVIAGSEVIFGDNFPDDYFDVSYDFALLRLTKDGETDPTFGPNPEQAGLVTIDLFGLDDQAESLAITENGDILLAGNTTLMKGPLPDNDFGVVRIKGTSTGTAVETETFGPGIRLDTSYPNPTHQQATIAFELPRASYVTLTIYDILGRVVQTIVEGHRSAGPHEAVFDASDLPSGVYLYRLETEAGALSGRLLYVR